MKKIPPAFRLTLKPDAIAALGAAQKKPFRLVPIMPRQDGGCDVAVTMNTADQLMTFARNGENLSDAVVRLLNKAKA